MANKTIVGFFNTGSSIPSGAKAIVFPDNAFDPSTPLNGTGDAVTAGDMNSYSFVLTEYTAGVRFYRVVLVDSGGTPISSHDIVSIPSDTAGTYYAGSFTSLNQAAFESGQIPTPETRTLDDTNFLAFYLDKQVTGAGSITGTKQINGATAAAISGTITYKYPRGNLWEYWLAYDADDRPTVPGFVQYVVTDGTDTWQFQLNIITTSSIDDLIKRGLHKLG